MFNKIFVTGSSGQLGSEIKSLVSKISTQNINWFFANRQDFDLSNHNSISEALCKFKPDLIINCAAWTAVDKAESEAESCKQINTVAPQKIAEWCKQNDSQLIHISTDFVFDGSKNTPYTEEDPCAPLGVYGNTKRESEILISQILPSAIILRSSWVYSSFGNNFVKTMQRLGIERKELSVVYDQIGTPTYAQDLAQAILHIIQSQKWHSGIYHFSNWGVCSWYDFAQLIFEKSNIQCTLRPIRSSQYPTPAKRPHFSVLDKSKFENTFDYSIRHWTVAFSDYLSI